MNVRTTRFGNVDIAEDRVISFPKGLLGFSEHKKYCLLEPADDSAENGDVGDILWAWHGGLPADLSCYHWPA